MILLLSQTLCLSFVHGHTVCQTAGKNLIIITLFLFMEEMVKLIHVMSVDFRKLKQIRNSENYEDTQVLFQT